MVMTGRDVAAAGLPCAAAKVQQHSRLAASAVGESAVWKVLREGVRTRVVVRVILWLRQNEEGLV
jgi:hypothetical protein